MNRKNKKTNFARCTVPYHWLTGDLFWIDLSRGKRRLGGSAFAQANGLLNEINGVPDLEVPGDFVAAFQCTQDLIHGILRCLNSSLRSCFEISPAVLEILSFSCSNFLIPEEQLTAGHDMSDGGLVVCLLEMAFAGNAVFDVDLPESDEYGKIVHQSLSFSFSHESLQNEMWNVRLKRKGSK